MRNRGSQQRATKKGGSPGAVNDGRRGAIHSWYIEEEEDPRLRKAFPDAEGHLFEVTLQRDGKSSLGVYVIASISSIYHNMLNILLVCTSAVVQRKLEIPGHSSLILMC